jgi:hypothetical protein
MEKNLEKTFEKESGAKYWIPVVGVFMAAKYLGKRKNPASDGQRNVMDYAKTLSWMAYQGTCYLTTMVGIGRGISEGLPALEKLIQQIFK